MPSTIGDYRMRAIIADNRVFIAEDRGDTLKVFVEVSVKAQTHELAIDIAKRRADDLCKLANDARPNLQHK